MKASEFLDLPMEDIEELFKKLSRKQLLSVSGQLFELIESCLLLSGLAGSLGCCETLTQARRDALAFHDAIWGMILDLAAKYERDMSRLN